MFKYGLSALLLIGGCSSQPNPGNDMAMGKSDMAMGGDMATSSQPDMGVTNTGTKIVGGKMLQLINVTSDDFVVYFDAKGALAVAPLTPGQSQTVLAGAGIGGLLGKVVFGWANVDMASNAGDLTVWTSATGSVSIQTPNVLASNNGASDDGTSIMYSVATVGDGTVADVYLSKSDGTGAKKFSPTPRSPPTAPPTSASPAASSSSPTATAWPPTAASRAPASTPSTRRAARWSTSRPTPPSGSRPTRPAPRCSSPTRSARPR